jgi:hypothetical protein
MFSSTEIFRHFWRCSFRWNFYHSKFSIVLNAAGFKDGNLIVHVLINFALKSENSLVCFIKLWMIPTLWYQTYKSSNSMIQITYLFSPTILGQLHW